MSPNFQLLADATTRTSFELGRIQTETDWLAPAAVFMALLVFIIFTYRRDTRELGRWACFALASLRIAAVTGLLIAYLRPQWRNEREVVQNSRLLVLVDTSLSMQVDDQDASPAEPNRAQQIAALLAENKFLDPLRRMHDVSVLRFDEDLGRITTLTKLPAVSSSPPPAENKPAAPAAVDWPKLLAPRGTETRLGQALRQVVLDDRTAPVAGIVIFTDGQQNAGLDPTIAADLAREAEIPLFPIGIGSNRSPVNVRISDFSAPARAYPGDRYTVTGFLQAQGLAGKTLTVELLSRPDDGKVASDRDARHEASQQVLLGGDGEVTPVHFELHPLEIGRRILVLRVQAPAEDRSAADNRREVAVEVVDRKTHVLLFAGGPSHEYQFLRNLLRRDKNVTVDVLLQTGSEGISQDAHEILDEFPDTRQEMFDYDCLVAFDPDWRQLSAAQVDLVERWVGEQAGGLITIAGPIYTDALVKAPNLAKIRDLYPVEFNRRFADLDDSHFGSAEPWPLEFTREGLEAPFLWLADSAPASAAIWSEFKGVFGYYAVRGSKPGATTYARFTDPRAVSGGQLPVYFSGQFYGSGRVFYMASGEMWRLRRLSDADFETFYTKVIRHVSQGRLQRGSNRGVLMTERDHYLPGNSVQLRAQLTSPQLEPLMASQVPLQVILPDGNLQTVRLTPDPVRIGSFRGQFTVRKEGSYRIELLVPESNDQRLTAPPIQVTIPDLERDHVERNDALLADLAQRTGGKYYIGINAALGLKPGSEPLSAQLKDHSRTMTLAAAPELLWNDAAPWHRGRWLLGAICGLLCLEWLLRRLLKLA